MKSGFSLRRPHRTVAISERGQGESILVVQTSFVGDLVLTAPLISEIRRRFPMARLTVLCNPRTKGILEGDPNIDELLAFDKRGYGRGLKLLAMARDLRKRSFTVVISPHKSFRSGLLVFLARIPIRIGFRESAGWFFYPWRVPRALGPHDVERNLSILRVFGIEPGECCRELRLAVDSRARESVAEVLHSFGLNNNNEDRFIFGLNVGSVWPTKRWSLDGYAKLMDLLKTKYPCEVVLFGGPEDGETVAELQRLSGHQGINLAGRFSLQELLCALDWCDVLISNDSGPMHMAVGRGIPVVAIFCATTPSLGFYPYSSNAVVVEKALHCRPCSSHGGRRCPLGTEDCIRLVTAEEVLRAVENIVESSGEVRNDCHLPQFMTL